MKYIGYFGKVLKSAIGIWASTIITLLLVVSLMINIALLFSQEVSLAIGTGLATVGITTVAKEMNTKLVERRSVVGTVTKRIARRTATGAVRNLASVPLEAVPYFGIATVLGVTALELNESCQDIKDIKEIDRLIGNESGLDEVKEVCGLKVPSKEELWGIIFGRD